MRSLLGSLRRSCGAPQGPMAFHMVRLSALWGYLWPHGRHTLVLDPFWPPLGPAGPILDPCPLTPWAFCRKSGEKAVATPAHPSTRPAPPRTQTHKDILNYGPLFADPITYEPNKITNPKYGSFAHTLTHGSSITNPLFRLVT